MGIRMAVRAAEGWSDGGFSGSRLAPVNLATAPKTVSQKDATIQANRMANRRMVTTSPKLSPSLFRTPNMRVTPATVDARTRYRKIHRRATMSDTAADQRRGHHQCARHGQKNGEKVAQQVCGRAGLQALCRHGTAADCRRTGHRQGGRVFARLGIHHLKPGSTHPTYQCKRDFTAKK